MDWSLGHYERIASQLLAPARAVVDRAAPVPGEVVIDVGCGTGNAALLAAERGARVIGVDPSPRLLEVARAQAAQRRLEATFVLGEAAALPLADASAEVVVSVFGAIFAPDALAAAAEIARVTTPGGRVVLSAWVPSGALFQANGARRRAVARCGASPGGRPFAWHDEDALERLLAPHGFSIEVREESVAFTAASPEDFVDAEFRDHPAWIAACASLEADGEMRALRASALEVFHAANEEPDAFRTTSSYVVATGLRG